MALREVLVDGRRWAVWNVVPGSATRETGQRVLPELRDGWLAIQSGGERRRLVPAPDGWESWPDEILAVAIRAAPRAKRNG